jgi:hypothetical protein
MKIIGFEEHYGLPAIYEAAKKANDPYLLVLETLKKAGHFPDDSKTGFPAGIYDLGDGRIAAMDDAGIDVQTSRTLRRARSASNRRYRGG